MLSLHHLEGGTFTLIRHQLSRCYTSPLFPQLTLVSRERVARLDSVTLDIATIPYLIASIISLPYLPSLIAIPYLLFCSAKPAIATISQSMKSILYSSFSHCKLLPNPEDQH